MYRLREMANIGEVVEKRLVEAGIHDPDQLRNIGSRQAFARIRRIDKGACYSMLCALEGAIQGVRWHSLSEEVKRDLKEYYDSLQEDKGIQDDSTRDQDKGASLQA